MPVHLPKTIEEAIHLLDSNTDATLLNGGTDLMVEINFNHRRPQSVIALKQISELKSWTINLADSSIFIGAGVPYAEIEKGELSKHLPALAAASRTVGSPQIRAAGTLGGNLGTCSPAGDSLPVLSALNARIHLASGQGVRVVPFSEYMVGPKKTSRNTNELIVGVSLPIANGYQGYSKVGVRNAMVISVASACLAIQDERVSIALGSVGPTIIRCTEAEIWINSNWSVGQELSDGIVKEFAQRVAAEARPIDDHRSTAEYRRHAISVLAQRLLQRSAQS